MGTGEFAPTIGGSKLKGGLCQSNGEESQSVTRTQEGQWSGNTGPALYPL